MLFLRLRSYLYPQPTLTGSPTVEVNIMFETYIFFFFIFFYFFIFSTNDIDECKELHPCINGTCTNKHGGFNCTCLDGYIKISNTSCREVNSLSVGLIAVFVGSLMLCCGMRKRKLIKLKEKFFEQNGGLMLQRRLSSEHGSSLETTRIFSAEELKSGTNNYDKSAIVGEGGYGTVYKGILANNMVVAIKTPKSIGARNVDPGQFINEVVVLMQINHRNVVRLLGCCLETEAPLLVYEFITNGTLFQHLHNKDSEDAETEDSSRNCRSTCILRC
ncbi:hypothetical protein UlMin_019220 [Ulmus minor]